MRYMVCHLHAFSDEFQTVNYIGWCALVGILYTAFPIINGNSTANEIHSL